MTYFNGVTPVIYFGKKCHILVHACFAHKFATFCFFDALTPFGWVGLRGRGRASHVLADLL